MKAPAPLISNRSRCAPSPRWAVTALWAWAVLGAALWANPLRAEDHGHAAPTAPAATGPATTRAASGNLAAQVKAAAENQSSKGGGNLIVLTKPAIDRERAESPRRAAESAGHGAPQQVAQHGAQPAPISRQYIRTRAATLAAQEPALAAPHAAEAAHGHAPHWSYEGAGGPQAWGELQPDFKTCAVGQRQSPIHIEDGGTLLGPAEPLQIQYEPSNGTVVNNGHTIQVDVSGGENTLTVRGSVYKLLQFHFHSPSEERVNNRTYAMVAHLVHKNAEGQLAVLAVLLEPGESNKLIDAVWTYMPLDANDRVRMPRGLLDLNDLLPKDRRYYQFLGSLTTPPCSEGVLWNVLKQPQTLGRDQWRVFSQLYPNNARPVQSLNGRVVREAK